MSGLSNRLQATKWSTDEPVHRNVYSANECALQNCPVRMLILEIPQVSAAWLAIGSISTHLWIFVSILKTSKKHACMIYVPEDLICHFWIEQLSRQLETDCNHTHTHTLQGQPKTSRGLRQCAPSCPSSSCVTFVHMCTHPMEVRGGQVCEQTNGCASNPLFPFLTRSAFSFS